MATAEKAEAARTAKKKFKSGPAAPDIPQLQDELAKIEKRFPAAKFQRTPQEDGSIVVAMVDQRTTPPLAIAIGQGEDTAAAVADLKKNLPLKGGAK